MYRQLIIEDTGCPPEDAEEVEDIMRTASQGGVLDYLTRDEFKLLALTAYDVKKLMEKEGW